MNKYEVMLQRLDADFRLELDEPDKYNISNEIRKNNAELFKNLNLLSELAFLIRNGDVNIRINREK